VSRRTGGFLELRRPLAASPERIFAVLTTPAEVARWWGPHLFSIPEVALDLRVGGAYRFTMQPPAGDPFHVSGEYREVVPPSRLSYTFRYDEPTPDDRETVVTVTVAAVGDRTELTVRQGAFATGERLALHRGGWTDSLDKLSAVLAAGE
jgi:uncharacterized protein YndB with AHSA1/START domain